MTITIPEPSLVVLIGASGCGKSSFAREHFKSTEVLSSDFCRGLGFVYQEVQMHCRQGKPECIEITLAAHGGMRGRCSECRRPAPGYDRLPERRWLFVPL